jgi:hypothetical protein
LTFGPFSDTAVKESSPSTQKRELDTSNDEVPWSLESAKYRHFQRVLPPSARALGSSGKRTEFGVAA